MRRKGQVTLCCERQGRNHIIDFVVVNVPDGKLAPLSGRDAQALNYLKAYGDEMATAVEKEKKNGEKSKTTARLTQRNILKTIFRLAKPAFFRYRCY